MSIVFITCVICYAIGMMLGYITCNFIHRGEKGIVDVDHESGLCRVRISSEVLFDKNTKKATVRINHNGDVSQNNQSL